MILQEIIQVPNSAARRLCVGLIGQPACDDQVVQNSNKDGDIETGDLELGTALIQPCDSGEKSPENTLRQVNLAARPSSLLLHWYDGSSLRYDSTAK